MRFCWRQWNIKAMFFNYLSVKRIFLKANARVAILLADSQKEFKISYKKLRKLAAAWFIILFRKVRTFVVLFGKTENINVGNN